MSVLNYLHSDADVAWYAQYGRPSQACYYPNIRKLRAKCMRALIAKGYDLKAFAGTVYSDFDGTVRFPAMRLKVE